MRDRALGRSSTTPTPVSRPAESATLRRPDRAVDRSSPGAGRGLVGRHRVLNAAFPAAKKVPACPGSFVPPASTTSTRSDDPTRRAALMDGSTLYRLVEAYDGSASIGPVPGSTGRPSTGRGTTSVGRIPHVSHPIPFDRYLDSKLTADGATIDHLPLAYEGAAGRDDRRRRVRRRHRPWWPPTWSTPPERPARAARLRQCSPPATPTARWSRPIGRSVTQ